MNATDLKPKKTTKIANVLKHLKNGESITSIQAINLYGATRLSSIIFVLRDRGYEIISTKQSRVDRNGNNSNFVSYSLVSDQRNELYSEKIKIQNKIQEIKETITKQVPLEEPQPQPQPQSKPQPKQKLNFFQKLWRLIDLDD